MPYPQLEYDAEYIAAAIGERWPAAVVEFIGRRQVLARSDECPPRYDAVPYRVDELRAPLAAARDVLLRGARAWFDANPEHFDYDGGQLVASLFPDLANGLQPSLTALIDGGNYGDLSFVLGILTGFKGKPVIYELVRSIVARLDRESPLLRKAWSVLCEGDGVRGEFGYAELYAERRILLAPWLADESEMVRTFAAESISDLDRWIAAENRGAEASIALRKLEYDEDLGDGKAE